MRYSRYQMDQRVVCQGKCLCGIKFDADASNLVQPEAFTLTAILLICLRCRLHLISTSCWKGPSINVTSTFGRACFSPSGGGGGEGRLPRSLQDERGGAGGGGSRVTEPLHVLCPTWRKYVQRAIALTWVAWLVLWVRHLHPHMSTL